jgi:hypothetical protein
MGGRLIRLVGEMQGVFRLLRRPLAAKWQVCGGLGLITAGHLVLIGGY